MHCRSLTTGLLTVCLAGIVNAKTPSQLRADLAGVLGPNKAALIVFQSLANTHVGQTNKILKLSSLDGTISDLLKDPPAGSFLMYPTFTMDGTRVVYCDEKNSTVYIANWADGVWKKVISGYTGSSSFKNSEGKDMILCRKTGAKTLHLVNADTPTDISTVYSGSLDPGYISISGDGKYIAAIWQGYGTIGVYQVGGTSAVKYLPCPQTAGSYRCEGGCWCTISRDDQYRVMWTVEPHAGCVIGNADGSYARDIACFPWIPTPGTSGDVDEDNPSQYNGLRWSNDQNIASCYQEGSGTPSINLKNNPYVINLSTMKYTCLFDERQYSLPGVMGIHVYSIPSGARSAPSQRTRAASGFAPPEGTTCDLRGRTLSDVRSAESGVRFRLTTKNTDRARSKMFVVLEP